MISIIYIAYTIWFAMLILIPISRYMNHYKIGDMLGTIRYFESIWWIFGIIGLFFALIHQGVIGV